MSIKIGTRKSKLALAQTNMVVNEIKKYFPSINIEVVHFTTKGDKVLNKPLINIGGKGVFVTEIEDALINKEIDLAVHSAKDLPLQLQDNLTISAVLKRGNYRDTLVTVKEKEIDFSKETVIGTGSNRRKLAFKNLYPNATFKDIRGNVDTRLNKLYTGEYDGIILAMAGLERLDLLSDSRFTFTPFDYKDFVPAPCQGIIAIESRNNDLTEILSKINHQDTFYAFQTERHILNILNADCGMPLGAYSFVENNKINVVYTSDSKEIITKSDLIENRFNLAESVVR
ncbi:MULTISPECIES: hydroxymethylbilane synthase [Ruminococcus]|uniref:Hydroxymethylbilane synthase n=1 Tax=Ruminococcus bovis TaxID=2564099 RepID=A0A4P8Y2N8_9FIRM|nr:MULTISPECIES: hydroxymethylbilane synthase [Ruminococcus]MEE3438658.1 hydroxymethylbilane synthase [Ruminococcus sp.]QCT07568.1 hydroxymethylbilane synthase [Ruminococcus bovis]